MNVSAQKIILSCARSLNDRVFDTMTSHFINDRHW